VRLVKAWKAAHPQSSIPGLRLVIAGHWDNRYPESKQQAIKLGIDDQVIFVGPVQEADLPALYSGAILFTFPTLYEGFGLPVLEAMACGTPVVCSNTSSLPEVVGEAALLVNPGQVDALTDAIWQVIRNEELRQDMRQKGLAQAARFSWQRTAQETLTAYEHCTGRRHAFGT